MTQDPKSNDRPVLAEVVQFGTGIDESERQSVLERLSSLTPRLGSFDPENLALEIWVRQRGTPDQTTFLTLKAGTVDLVAHSNETELLTAVSDAGSDMRRQLDDQRSRRTDHRRR